MNSEFRGPRDDEKLHRDGGGPHPGPLSNVGSGLACQKAFSEIDSHRDPADTATRKEMKWIGSSATQDLLSSIPESKLRGIDRSLRCLLDTFEDHFYE